MIELLPQVNKKYGHELTSTFLAFTFFGFTRLGFSISMIP